MSCFQKFKAWDASGITTFHIPEVKIHRRESLGQRGFFFWHFWFCKQAERWIQVPLWTFEGWNLRNHSTSRHSRHPTTKKTLRLNLRFYDSLEVFPPKKFGNLTSKTSRCHPWPLVQGQIPADLKADRPQPNTWPATWRMAFMPFDPKSCAPWMTVGVQGGLLHPGKFTWNPKKNGGLECLEDHFPISSWWCLGSMLIFTAVT